MCEQHLELWGDVVLDAHRCRPVPALSGERSDRVDLPLYHCDATGRIKSIKTCSELATWHEPSIDQLDLVPPESELGPDSELEPVSQRQ